MARPRKSTTYRAVHKRLRTDRGRAADSECCRCDRVAREWAYLYNGDPEMVDPDGKKYSLDLSCYAPMCASCHRKWDHLNDPERHAVKAQKARERILAMNQDPAYHDVRVENGRRNGKAAQARRVANGTDAEWHRAGALASHARFLRKGEEDG